MNKTKKRLRLIIVICVLIISIMPTNTFANSAEPPSLVILINNPPEDLSIVLVSNETQPEALARRVAWEGYYVFYSRDMQDSDEYTFKITTKGKSFKCKLSAPLQHYNNVVTLDLPNQTLTPGKYALRSVLLVTIRLLLTLFLEGIIFWLFRFRQKRSWLTFLTINLVTQGALNIWLNSGDSLMPSYMIIGLIIGEVFVFAVEMIAFPIFVKEHKKSHILIYVFVANLISLIAGGYLITILPI